VFNVTIHTQGIYSNSVHYYSLTAFQRLQFKHYLNKRAQCTGNKVTRSFCVN